MKSPVVPTTVAVLLSLLIAGCGRSPLLHHDNEATPQTKAPLNQTSSETCALSWRRPQGTLCAQVQWMLPPIVGENRLRLSFNGPLDGAAVTASADMPDMGHGTSPITVTIVNDRTVELTDVWLIMNGVWVLRVGLDADEAHWSVEL